MGKSYTYLFKYIKLIFKTGKIGIVISFMMMALVTGINIILPEIIKRIIDYGIGAEDINAIIILSCTYMLFILLSNAIDLALNNYFEKLKLKVSTNLKMNLLNRLAQSNGKYLSNQETGNILRILDNDIFQVESFGIELLINFVMNGATAIIVFFILMKFNILLLLLIVFIQMTMFIFQSIISNHITYNIKKVREIAGDQSNFQEQFVSNIKGAILTNVIDYFQKLFIKKQAMFVKQSKKVNLLITIHSKVASTFSSMSTILTYLIGGIMIISNKMSYGELVAFLQYISLLIAPCMFFVNSNIKIKQTTVSLEKIYKVIENIEVVTEKKDCLKLTVPIQAIHFKSVDFTYSDKQILKDLNFSLLRNEVTVIVGESGCGKSTLLCLLYRLWDIDKGRIVLNDKKIDEYNISSLRKKICIVSQEALIFNDNINENIKMNNDQVCDETILNICNLVGLTSLMCYSHEIGDDNIGERGNKLSGGQKQRVAIARALVNECDVLIFDESTSALDNISQKELMENIRPYFKNKIVILIAHRISLAKFADKVIVMKDGTVIEFGNHKTLIDYKGVYYKMASLI